MKKLKEISDRMKEQDNRMTANPIFLVQQRKRIFGIDLDYTDDIVWILDDWECYEDDTDPEFLKAKAYYEEHFEMPEDWTRTGYIDTWVFVQPFFSLKAAEAYVKANKHNLTEPRVYVDSAYRNYEWQAVREVLIAMQEEDDV